MFTHWLMRLPSLWKHSPAGWSEGGPFLRSVLAGALLIGIGCATTPQVTDPHALAPEYDRWDAAIPGLRAEVFNATLRVLSDSAFQIVRSDPVNGIIETRARTETDSRRGASQLRTTVGDASVTLRFLLSQQGTNTTHLIISGSVQTISGVTVPLVATDGRWHFLRGVGEAVLARFAH